MFRGTSKLRAIWVGVRPNLACPDISPLVSKESSFLGVLLPEIGVTEGLLKMVDVVEEGALFYLF
jgi:hypothetical protein